MNQLLTQEKIGRCDGCALIDHHLIGGLCPVCRGTGGNKNELRIITDTDCINWAVLKRILSVGHPLHVKPSRR